MDKTISSRTLFGHIFDQSTSYNIAGVGIMLVSPKNSVIYLVMIFIAVPRSIRVLGIIIFLIWIVIVGFLGSSYLTSVVFPILSYGIFPNTLIVGGSLGFLPNLLTHRSLTILV
jgi:hypothetical protein